MADFFPSAVGDVDGMKIVIEVQTTAPPSGIVVLGGETGEWKPEPFAGWLGLMRVLEELMSEVTPGASPAV